MQKEYTIQCQIFSWSEMMASIYPCLHFMHSSPVGQSLSIVQATLQKRKGVKKGVPDICLPYPTEKWHGLYIELKADGGKTSETQREWLEYLNRAGYYACVCTGYEEAVEAIENYIKEVI